jgi:hypothetical protein
MQVYLNFYRLLGAFANCRRATIGFIILVCPSVFLTQGTNRVPMDRLFENELLSIFRKYFEEFLNRRHPVVLQCSQ